MTPNDVTILEVSKAEDVLANLMQLYRYDLSEFNDDEIYPSGKLDVGKYLDVYWLEPVKSPTVPSREALSPPAIIKAMPSHVITVRHTEPSDFRAFHEIFSQPRAVHGTAQLPFPSAESWRKKLENPPPGFYSLVACAGDEVVGNLGLHTPANPRRRHVGSIGMAVRDDWQGKGVGSALMQAATELADRWLNLTRLELEVYTDNAPAIRLYEKFGFVREGTHRQYAFRDGMFVDAYAMARLRSVGSSQLSQL